MDTVSFLTPQLELLLPFLTPAEKENAWKVLHNRYLNGMDEKNYSPSGVDKEKGLFYLALRLYISLADNYPTIVLKWGNGFTLCRLFLMRDGREHNVFHHTYTVSCHGYTNILQFSYALEIVACLVQLWNNPSLRHDSEWQSTFSNALLWLIVNAWSLLGSFKKPLQTAWL